jgi:acetoin utilization deacetylase AcuC-like enzyme
MQVHHGNGTQKVFWEDDRVLFVSLHRRDKDFYPEVRAMQTMPLQWHQHASPNSTVAGADLATARFMQKKLVFW